MSTRLVTIFGGSGFLGRYVAQAVFAAGMRVRFAERDPRRAYARKALGNLGQTQFAAADVTDLDSVRRVVDGTHAVINLVGVFGGQAEAVNVRGAANVAKAAAETGADALVHVSGLAASPDSPSDYGRTKAKGEEAVRDAFPHATILRPSVIFGREDQFLNRFAGMIRALPMVPVVRGEAQLQPVYVDDVAVATASAAKFDSPHRGRTYELGGPEMMTMEALLQWIAKETERDANFLSIPDFVSGPMATLTGWLPGAPITRDQWNMLGVPNVVAEGANGLNAFGIVPTPLSAVAEGWLTQYRRHGRFAQRVAA